MSTEPAPYIDTLKVLIVPDTASALAAIRAGNIDAIVKRKTQRTFLGYAGHYTNSIFSVVNQNETNEVHF